MTMGYKSILRSAASAANAAQKEALRQKRAKLKIQEKLQRKMGKLDEKKEKIIDALQDEYAKGKITKEKYDQLLARKEDITVDLLVFGGTPGASAAKRYITGKIEKPEFERLSQEVVPDDVREEKKMMVEAFRECINRIEEFSKRSTKQEEGKCSQCGKGGFLQFIRNDQGLLLCHRCRSLLKNITNFKGLSGKFYEMEPIKIDLSSIGSIHPTLLIRSECLL